jgi:nucleoside-diphosphate-sugar epimerase
LKYLVTGGAGFVGSHLCELLIEQGHSVVIIDDLSTGRIENVAHLEKSGRLRIVVDSVAREPLVEDAVKECDRVFHLAAAVGVRLILEQPTRTIETNIEGTEVVLRHASRHRRRVVITSTSEVYGKSEKVPFREEDDVILGPTHRARWAYAASKMVDEFLALAYWTEKRLPVVIARLFNTVGARQTGRYGMVIPRLVGQALKGEPLTVYGDGEQSRCFGSVRDVTGGLDRLMGCDAATGEVVNLGNPEEITINGLAKLILEVTGSKSNVTHIPYDQAFAEGFEDMRRRVPDISKAKRLVGFDPKIGLRQIIEDVADDLRRRGTQT